MSYLIPAAYSGVSTFAAHKRRTPPSTEPGVDYYMPIGTPLLAPADCRVVAIGGGILPATGRFVLLDDGTRWLRGLHLSRFECGVGDELRAGRDVFGLSGASGYGSEFFGATNVNDAAMIRRTGGPHVHMTAFKGRAYTFGSGTVDFHALTGGAVAGGGNSTPGDDDMSVQDIFDARDGDGRNMLDLGRQTRADIAALREYMATRPNLDADKDYAAFTRMMQRGFSFDIRPAGVGADWKLGPTVFESLAAADDSKDIGGIKVTLSDADRAMIAKAVADAVKIPTGGATKADVEAAIKAGLASLVLKPAAV